MKLILFSLFDFRNEFKNVYSRVLFSNFQMKLLEFFFLLLNSVTRKVSSFLISCNKRISSVFFAQIEY